MCKKESFPGNYEVVRKDFESRIIDFVIRMYVRKVYFGVMTDTRTRIYTRTRVYIPHVYLGDPKEE